MRDCLFVSRTLSDVLAMFTSQTVCGPTGHAHNEGCRVSGSGLEGISDGTNTELGGSYAGRVRLSRISHLAFSNVPLENPERSGRERIILLCEFSPSMPTCLLALLITLGSILRSRLDLQLEILAMRHQIGVLKRSVHKPSTDVHRSSSVGRALPLVAPLGFDVAHCQAGNGCGLASQRLPPILELERRARTTRRADDPPQTRHLIGRMCRRTSM